MCQKLFHWVGEMPQFLKDTLLTKKPKKSQGGLSNMLWVQKYFSILF